LGTDEFDSKVFSTRAILAGKNVVVDSFNDYCINKIPGELTTYLSTDTILNDNQTALYSSEFLNTIDSSGLPSHELKLKVGMPIILIRNIAPNNGLCNGTRLICKRFYDRLIEAEILIGKHAGRKVFIPRMPLIPSDDS
jgi:ATP-dependent DNA helicase PIF1